MSNKPTITVFWKHDTFPYVLWDVVAEATKNDYKLVGYGGMRVPKDNVVKVLPTVQAESLTTSLEMLRHERSLALKTFQERAKVLMQ
jgi:hypothetical protein